MHLAGDVHVQFVKEPALRTTDPYPVNPLAANVSPEPAPPQPYGLTKKVDATLEMQDLGVPQARKKPNVHHDRQANHVGRRMEIPERIF